MVALKQHPPEQVLLCDVVKAELYYGAYKSVHKEHNLAVLSVLFTQFASLPFDGRAAQVFGQLRIDLERQGRTIGPYDLQIAAIALANDAILVTHNVREFSRVSNLHLEDWEERID
jgi:tRNA(fMet)-specific endonuclease VapC